MIGIQMKSNVSSELVQYFNTGKEALYIPGVAVPISLKKVLLSHKVIGKNVYVLDMNYPTQMFDNIMNISDAEKVDRFNRLMSNTATLADALADVWKTESTVRAAVLFLSGSKWRRATDDEASLYREASKKFQELKAVAKAKREKRRAAKSASELKDAIRVLRKHGLTVSESIAQQPSSEIQEVDKQA